MQSQNEYTAMNKSLKNTNKGADLSTYLVRVSREEV